MTKQLTNKTWFINYQMFQIWIDDLQAKRVAKQIQDGAEYLKIDGRLLPAKSCALLKGEDNINLQKIKRGVWKCQYGYEHEPNQQCGHNLIKVGQNDI